MPGRPRREIAANDVGEKPRLPLSTARAEELAAVLTQDLRGVSIWKRPRAMGQLADKAACSSRPVIN